MGKSQHSVYVDNELWKRAIEAGLNVSRICEKALWKKVLLLEEKEEER